MTAGSTGIHDYRVFGLKVRSEIELPELFTDESEARPDVAIRIGEVGSANHEAGLHADSAGLVLVVQDVGRFRIAGGKSIVVEPAADVPERNVRLFLLGSAFGALLHQRGFLPLHANAVEIDGKAAAFMGASGSGKSTLAAWFHDRGFAILADDVCVVRLDAEGRPIAYPGLPRLRLSDDALEATGRRVGQYPRSFLGEDDFRKYDVSIRANAARSACELGAVFILAKGDQVALEELSGIEAVQALFDNTYRGAFLDQVNGHQAHWTAAVQLVRKVPLFTLARTWNIDRLDEQCELILETVRETARLRS
jgi:hypothetical protein